MSRAFPIFLILLGLAAPPAGAAEPGAGERAGRHGWVYFDAPVWDISNEGLPFRLTFALPSERGLLSRLLFTAEARWTASVGYAKVYNSYDRATGVFKNPGGHAAFISVGREFRWHLPEVLGAFAPKVLIEFGAHYATRRFPADGTHANFKLISGLEWSWENAARSAAWSTAIVWPHFSNANVLNRNSGYDGLALRFGRSLRF